MFYYQNTQTNHSHIMKLILNGWYSLINQINKKNYTWLKIGSYRVYSTSINKNYF